MKCLPNIYIRPPVQFLATHATHATHTHTYSHYPQRAYHFLSEVPAGYLICPGIQGSLSQEPGWTFLRSLLPKLATSAHILRAISASPSHRPNPPLALSLLGPAGSNLPGAAGGPPLQAPARPSQALHPRRGGSECRAALGPFPAGMNEALWNSQRNLGSLAAVFLGAALSQISGEARRLGFQ